MNIHTKHYRPIGAYCGVLTLLCVSLWLLAGAEYGPAQARANSAYSVSISDHGVDAREMERRVAIPLEDALSALPGAVWTSSSSEYGKVKVLVRFAAKSNQELAYEAVREAANRVYASLPSSAQRPELGSSSEGSFPVWVASIEASDGGPPPDGSFLERVVKPAFEKLDGAGEVHVYGVGLRELAVLLEEDALSLIGLSATAVAKSLALEDSYCAAGSIQSGGLTIPVVLDGRYPDAQHLLGHVLASKEDRLVALSSFAVARERERRPDSLSRVNGQRARTISVMPGGGANLLSLSRAIRAQADRLALESGMSFRVISDSGAEMERAYGQALWASAQAAFAVAVVCLVLVGGRGARAIRARAAAVLLVPIAFLAAAAVLSALGFALDRFVLSGLAAGLGASVDAGILASDRLARARNATEAREGMKRLSLSLAGGTLTTLVVLAPMAGLEYLSEGTSRIAIAIGAVNLVSYLLCVLAMPSIVVGATEENDEKTKICNIICHGRTLRFRRLLKRAGRRLLARLSLCAKRYGSVLVLSGALIGVLGAIALSFLPMSLADEGAGDRVEAHVEFEAGLSMEEADRRLGLWADTLKAVPGIQTVLTTARRGSGSALVEYEAESIVQSKVDAILCSQQPLGGFVWLPRPSPSERSWTIQVYGKLDGECRRLARILASELGRIDAVLGVVLNFKDGPADLILVPDRERIAATGLGLRSIGDALRRSVYGPVAYKRVEARGERDTRIGVLRDASPTIPEVLETLVVSPSGPVGIGSVTTTYRQSDAQSIRREDRSRVASLSVRTEAMDPCDAFTLIKPAIDSLELPDGYSVVFDRDAMEGASRLRASLWFFVLAIALCYMVLAALSESLGSPLVALATLPPALAVPALALLFSGRWLDVGLACAFVAVSGMAVNASIIGIDDLRFRLSSTREVSTRPRTADLYACMRATLPSLAATSCTGIAGSLPFLFLGRDSNALTAAIGFVSVWGNAASFFFSAVLVPAMASVFPGLFSQQFPASTSRNTVPVRNPVERGSI